MASASPADRRRAKPCRLVGLLPMRVPLRSRGRSLVALVGAIATTALFPVDAAALRTGTAEPEWCELTRLVFSVIPVWSRSFRPEGELEYMHILTETTLLITAWHLGAGPLWVTSTAPGGTLGSETWTSTGEPQWEPLQRYVIVGRWGPEDAPLPGPSIRFVAAVNSRSEAAALARRAIDIWTTHCQSPTSSGNVRHYEPILLAGFTPDHCEHRPAAEARLGESIPYLRPCSPIH